jgi:hypothetical protein
VEARRLTPCIDQRHKAAHGSHSLLVPERALPEGPGRVKTRQATAIELDEFATPGWPVFTDWRCMGPTSRALAALAVVGGWRMAEAGRVSPTAVPHARTCASGLARRP